MVSDPSSHEYCLLYRCPAWTRWVFGVTAVGILVGYRPPKRHSLLDHLSFWQKFGHLDLAWQRSTVCRSFTIFGWSLSRRWSLHLDRCSSSSPAHHRLFAFGFYEVYGTKIGILHHGLFKGPHTNGRVVAICTLLIAAEAILGFSYLIFYPSLTTSLFTTDPMKLVARLEGYWIACAIGSIIFGFFSTRYRTVREPLAVGFLITSSMVSDSGRLSSLSYLSTRAVAATVFTAIYAAALRTQLDRKTASYDSEAALGAGLPVASLTAFLGAFLTNDADALMQVPGVTPTIVATSLAAMKQAFADSFRIIYIIAAPFGVVAVIAACFLGSVKHTMNYGVDAPVEKLHAKHYHEDTTQNA
ncbi:uncharacterized protein Z518_02120 [Rhinocladiella mackenziei CBS 650.93]|uniref:Uncharacterized protein n=1 Tax=Rhinocladiella mackenziei CBS 650.93 TaxID=1442369 RepID=A0A0D2FYW9_9EURO|nr:uncharacterized protein Z518_02120 [Rhinocladiella mackenziei CBS 650.93]KIX07467.1 hypothetical protein Z518_02120 [Rhinocladiella mackenziei CBS 650.93]